MGTLVALHAHPDDESLTTGGTLARASAVAMVEALSGVRMFKPARTEGFWRNGT